MNKLITVILTLASLLLTSAAYATGAVETLNPRTAATICIVLLVVCIVVAVAFSSPPPLEEDHPVKPQWDEVQPVEQQPCVVRITAASASLSKYGIKNGQCRKAEFTIVTNDHIEMYVVISGGHKVYVAPSEYIVTNWCDK